VQKNPLTLLWDVFLAGMILYFVLSIIDSAVQEHLASVHEEEVELERKKHETEDQKDATQKRSKKATSEDAAEVVSEAGAGRPLVRSTTRNQTDAVQVNRSPSPTRRSTRLSPTLTKKNN
jgi:hypothetical protein